MNKKLSLLNDSSDSESSKEECEFKINKNYAENYGVWRNKEELQKLKDLSKDVSSSSSSTETEGEYNSEDELNFYRTLSLLKAKDPRIYDKNTVFYKNKTVEKKKKVKKPKPLYMKEYERNIVVERHGKFSSDEEEHIPAKGPAYSEEQEDLKRSFKAALGDSDDEEDDNLLNVRKKTKKEKEQEEADYVRWLKGEEVDLPEDTKKDLLHLRNYFNDPNLDKNEKFLRDFFLNRKWDEKASDEEIPSYDVVSLSEDERITEEQDKFERAYNFRFEEPDEEFIKRYPRVIEDSLRKTDTRRKVQREEYTKRKKKEKEQKREELKRLKALKRKEIEEKFALLKEVSGQDDLKLDEDDIESDFDPDRHEQRMREMFNDDFYGVEEVQKPEFPYDEEIDTENWDHWAGTGEDAVKENDNEPSYERNYNCLEDTEVEDINKVNNNAQVLFEKEMVEATQTKKKRVKKKSLFAKTISTPKPVFDPSGKSYDEYLDEYYKLDYEDTIGDMPVRFRYRKVIPNSFGLTVDDILTANDKELNRWCSIKKTCQYRDETDELYDVQAFQKKAENTLLKKKVLPSIYMDNEEKQSQGIKKKRKKKSKHKSNEIVNHNLGVTYENKHETNEDIGSNLTKNAGGNVEERKSSGRDSGVVPSVGRKRKKRSKHGSNETYNHNLSTNICETKEMDVTLASGSSSGVGTGELQNSGKETEERQSNGKKRRKKKKKSKITLDEMGANSNTSAVIGHLSKNSEVLSSDSTQRLKGDLNEETQNLGANAEESFIDKSQKTSFHKQKNPNRGKYIDSSEYLNPSNDAKLREEEPSQTCITAAQTNSEKLWGGNKYGHTNNTRNLYTSNKFKNIDKNLTSSNTGFSQKHNKRQEKNFNKHNVDKQLTLTDERLAAYGINPKKFRNKTKYSQK